SSAPPEGRVGAYRAALGGRFGSPPQANEAFLNQARAVMMLELDAFEVAVAFATNLASGDDEAFVRRIGSHVRFSLPDEGLRRRLWGRRLWGRYLPPTLPLGE